MFVLSAQHGAGGRKSGQPLSSSSQTFTVWLHYLVWKWISKTNLPIVKCKYKQTFQVTYKWLILHLPFAITHTWWPAIQWKHHKTHPRILISKVKLQGFALKRTWQMKVVTKIETREKQTMWPRWLLGPFWLVEYITRRAHTWNHLINDVYFQTSKSTYYTI